MKTQKFLLMLVGLIVLLSLISACSAATPEPTKAPAPTSAPAAPTKAAAAEPTKAPAAPTTAAAATKAPEPTKAAAPSASAWQAKPANWTEAMATKSFTYHTSEDIVALAKWSTTTNNTIQVISYLVFDPLIVQDEDGQYKPWLAKAWKFTDDAKSVTFELRDDVYFTDGNKMTAADVIFTLEQLRDDKTHYPDSVVSNLRRFFGKMEKIDDYKFTLNLNQPMPEFYYQMTAPGLEIFSKAAFEKMGYDAFWKNPVGTGAYVVESYNQPNSIIKLTLRTDKNGYWGYKASNRYTNVKNITIQYSAEAQTRLASLRSKEIQMINTVPPTEKANLDKQGFTTMLLTPMNTVFLQMATAKGDTFENAKLREALSLAIDRDVIVATLLNGYATPARWPARQGDLGYEEKPATPITYNKAKAQQLVKESGYTGKEVNFIYTQAYVNIGNELAQAIQSMAAEVGIKVKISPLERATYDEARLKHQFDIVLAAIGYSGNAWYKTAHDVIGMDRFNTGVQNKKLKDLAISLENIVDEPKAAAIYKQIYAIETTEFDPHIYLYWPSNINAWDVKVTGALWHKNQYPDLSSLVIKD